MGKKLTVTDSKFSHETGETTVELIEAADKGILILSVKRDKQHITTSLSKADLHILLEFFKLRGVE
jgi:hypothetical protein